MQELPGAPSPASFLRWATFIVAAVNMTFILSYGRLQDFASVTTMAGPAVATLGPALVAALPGALLAGGFMLFYVVALWPRRCHVPIYNQLVLPIVAIFLLASAFVATLRLQMYGLSCLLLTAGAIVSAAMFVRVASVSPYRHSSWLRVPFSLCLAVLTVATIAAGSYWLNASLIRPFQIDVAPVSLPAGSALVVAIGAALAVRYHEFVYPLVVAIIAAVAAGAAWKYDSSAMMGIVVVCVGMLLASLLAALASARDPRDRRSGPLRYAREQARESAANADSAAKPPTMAHRNRKVARSSSASSERVARQQASRNPDTGSFQGSPTIS